MYRARSIRGFTLIEAALTTIIIGVGVVAVLQLLAAGSFSNAQSTNLTTAINLAGNIHEATLRMDYTTLFTLNGKTYTPPVDARLIPIPQMSTWSQKITVQYVDPDRLTFTVPDTQIEPTTRISVTINHNNKPVYTSHWLATAPQ